MVRDVRSAVDLVPLPHRRRPHDCAVGVCSTLGGLNQHSRGWRTLAVFRATPSAGTSRCMRPPSTLACPPWLPSLPSLPCAPTLRTDLVGRPTGGLRRLFETHALLPRLGFFEREPHRVPYDFDELLRAIAPRPALLHTPTRDRDANASEVDALIDRVRWARLVQHAPPTATRMGSAEVKVLVRWLEEEVAGVTPRVRDVR
ncbi:hypothetical protein EMIHUDRAFT_358568 [Emiliania huxleyi CCMP1516]|uniref:Uncharacterized protein n=2 Tax=Emiliania huxleyi TaxID=2903 RepID=A0A0D3IDG5_EMIH1|nr:hypothetical protein EMIHUDRAFT_358568 [Emiliania huxleyi CCMP1516]EOD09300.1 hypothetical protein EMIHUDRAFT_358568 [Emiliania huxleyi CCMP1516]|eukprot:XP_005761729.1 hypothetical protein EMIHUDRAFT_358568 [Emiliania huxleyi CCMP1516]